MPLYRLNRKDRYQLIDTIRGVAFVFMVIYHVCYFSMLYGYLDLNFDRSLFWKGLQKSIAGTFFLLVGINLYLANTPLVRPKKYLYRLARLILFAGVVTAASLFLNPKAVVTFGILHSIAVCSVLGLPFIRLKYSNVFIGLSVITLSISYSHPVFNHSILYWTGLGTYSRMSFDFQPLFPWLGVVVTGITLGHYFPGLRVASWHSDSFLARLMTLIGQNSLILYMLHVPIIIGTLETIRFIR